MQIRSSPKAGVPATPGRYADVGAPDEAEHLITTGDPVEEVVDHLGVLPQLVALVKSGDVDKLEPASLLSRLIRTWREISWV